MKKQTDGDRGWIVYDKDKFRFVSHSQSIITGWQAISVLPAIFQGDKIGSIKVELPPQKVTQV